ncbi:MAG: hypothetical protein ACLQF0_03595 [Dissulfurispiraceae bacterium]
MEGISVNNKFCVKLMNALFPPVIRSMPIVKKLLDSTFDVAVSPST